MSWQLSDPDTGDPVIDNANAITNEAIKAIAAVDRWPNYGLNVTLTGDAAEASITLGRLDQRHGIRIRHRRAQPR